MLAAVSLPRGMSSLQDEEEDEDAPLDRSAARVLYIYYTNLFEPTYLLFKFIRAMISTLQISSLNIYYTNYISTKQIHSSLKYEPASERCLLCRRGTRLKLSCIFVPQFLR